MLEFYGSLTSGEWDLKGELKTQRNYAFVSCSELNGEWWVAQDILEGMKKATGKFCKSLFLPLSFIFFSSFSPMLSPSSVALMKGGTWTSEHLRQWKQWQEMSKRNSFGSGWVFLCAISACFFFFFYPPRAVHLQTVLESEFQMALGIWAWNLECILKKWVF